MSDDTYRDWAAGIADLYDQGEAQDIHRPDSSREAYYGESMNEPIVADDVVNPEVIQRYLDKISELRESSAMYNTGTRDFLLESLEESLRNLAKPSWRLDYKDAATIALVKSKVDTLNNMIDFANEERQRWLDSNDR